MCSQTYKYMYSYEFFIILFVYFPNMYKKPCSQLTIQPTHGSTIQRRDLNGSNLFVFCPCGQRAPKCKRTGRFTLPSLSLGQERAEGERTACPPASSQHRMVVTQRPLVSCATSMHGAQPRSYHQCRRRVLVIFNVECRVLIPIPTPSRT
jgi:hypothetical protein